MMRKQKPKELFIIKRLIWFILLTLLALIIFARFTYKEYLVPQEATYISCSGSGHVTVLLDSGVGGTHLDWALVQDEIAKLTRVCSYDRPGMGKSEISDVSSLHELLKEAKVEGPYFLVGHSIGGPRMLLYAHTYQQDIAGVLLLDPTIDNIKEKQLAYVPENQKDIYEKYYDARMNSVTSSLLFQKNLLAVTNTLGITNLLMKNVAAQNQLYKRLPDDKKEEYIEFAKRREQLETTRKDALYANENATRIYQNITSLKNIPLIILSANSLRTYVNDPRPSYITDDETEKLAVKVKNDMQKELLNLSTNAQYKEIENTGHFIQVDRPEVVIEEIQKFLKTY